jgi:cell division control protein 7
MTAPQVKEYMRALFTALAHLHNHRDSNGQLKPVIHRDVKPGNFLYSMKDNTFALVDFGLAHYQDAENPYQPELPLLQTLVQPTHTPTQKQYPTPSTSIRPPLPLQNSVLQNNDINNSNRKRKRDENNFGDDVFSQQKKFRVNQAGPILVSTRQQNSSVSNAHNSNATLSQFQSAFFCNTFAFFQIALYLFLT